MASMLEQIALYDMSKKEKTSVDYETWAAMSDDLSDSNKVIVPKNKNIEDPTDDGGGANYGDYPDSFLSLEPYSTLITLDSSSILFDISE